MRIQKFKTCKQCFVYLPRQLVLSWNAKPQDELRIIRIDNDKKRITLELYQESFEDKQANDTKNDTTVCHGGLPIELSNAAHKFPKS